VANSLTTNPWILNTPGAAILYLSDVYVDHMEWTGYVAGASCSVQDRFGKTIWAPTPAGDLEEVRTGKMDKVHGIALITLTSGTVTVHIR
jgi:hypothetical protein